jgi:hypothetical protein
MRKLWSDHVIWTREYIVAAIAGAPDANAAAARLLKNQEDIGGAVAAFYGKKAGDTLTGLLKQHIMIAVDLIGAAKANDQAKYSATDQRWKKNGEEIADFLSRANPNWPRAASTKSTPTSCTCPTRCLMGSSSSFRRSSESRRFRPCLRTWEPFSASRL